MYNIIMRKTIERRQKYVQKTRCLNRNEILTLVLFNSSEREREIGKEIKQCL